ncbi:MAG: PaaI family thioesterase [Mycobacterium sp.]|nr:PaaI family thioesterase [Mycobacterium sp.]
MSHLGAQLVAVSAGQVCVRVPYAPKLSQQHGYFHAGVSTAIADTAGGYAAQSVHPAGSDVLTVALTINLIAPAHGAMLVATGTVVRAGRTLTVCTLTVTVEGPQHCAEVAVGQQTICRIMPRP